jgi:hypothetical protein
MHFLFYKKNSATGFSGREEGRNTQSVRPAHVALFSSCNKKEHTSATLLRPGTCHTHIVDPLYITYTLIYYSTFKAHNRCQSEYIHYNEIYKYKAWRTPSHAISLNIPLFCMLIVVPSLRKCFTYYANTILYIFLNLILQNNTS